MSRKTKPAGKIRKNLTAVPPPDPTFISAPQLLARYGGRSHMWLVRVLERDQTFPRPVYVGRLRFFPVAELAAWERKTAAKSRAA